MKRNTIRQSGIVLMTFTSLFCLLSTGLRAEELPLTISSTTPVSYHSLYQYGEGMTHDHVFLFTSGSPVDVTNTLYTAHGQAYAVLNSTPIALFFDSVSNNVYNSQGQVIGYTMLMNDTPK